MLGCAGEVEIGAVSRGFAVCRSARDAVSGVSFRRGLGRRILGVAKAKRGGNVGARGF
jgi:hypothetical protein